MDEINLGGITLLYDCEHKLLQIVQGEEVIGTAEFVQPEEWDEMCDRTLSGPEAEAFMAVVMGDTHDVSDIDTGMEKLEAISGKSYK